MIRKLLTAVAPIAAITTLLAGCEYQSDGSTADNSTNATPVAQPEEPAPQIGGPELSSHQAQVMEGEGGQPDRLLFDYFHFAPPQGWTVRGIKDIEVLRIFDKGDASDPDARITVYRRRASTPNVTQNAEAFGADWNGTVQGDQLVLGSTEAKLISRDHPGSGLQIVDAVLCKWMVEDFIIQGEAKPGVDVRQDVLDLAASWQWLGRG